MLHDDLPERWKQKVRDYLIATGNTKYEKFGAAEFSTSSTVRIKFEDNSKVKFRYALVIEAPEFREIGVFTEHCGYHIFQSYEGLELSIEKR